MELSLLSEDRAFINRKLTGVPYNLRQQIMATYATVWKEAYETEPNELKKENAGRRAANSFLLSYVDSRIKKQ